jgi:hypothetical protein
MHRCPSLASIAIVFSLALASASVCVDSAAAQQQQTPPEVQRGHEAFAAEDWERAVEAYRAALAVGFGHGTVHLRLGYSLHMLGRYEEALESHRRTAAVAHPELRIDGLYNSACACALLGRRDEAIEYFARAIDAGFEDTEQVSRDTDLDSLRDDPRFKSLADGIGIAPTLHEQMDFFLGEWTCLGENDEVILTLTFARPLAGSSAIVSTSTQAQRSSWTGLAVPDPEHRTWTWTYADDTGTTMRFVGTRDDATGGMSFVGSQWSPVGEGVKVRLTFTPRDDGTVGERAEVSEDGGATWRVHHESRHVKRGDAE